MTREEFIAEHPLREGDSVDACHCGSCDCPGFKLVNIPEQRRLMDAMDRLPEVLAKAAYGYGHELAMKREQAFLDALLGETPMLTQHRRKDALETMSEPRPTYIPPAYLAFTPEQREACQRWHDANDEFFEDHQTVDQRAEMFRRTEAALKESRAIATATLRNAPPCGRCGARAGEPCKSIAHEVGK